MKKVRVALTGEIFIAMTDLELVDKLRDSSFNPEASISDYMKQYARRSVIYSGHDIRATGVREFITDLIKFGHIVLVDDNSSFN